MTLDEQIKEILQSAKTKTEKNRELSKLGLRPADINTIWFKYINTPAKGISREDFRTRYPEAPEPSEREVLNLILRKEIAHEIVSGKKKVEIREVSPFYTSRLYDKRVLAFLDEHPEIKCDFYTPLMKVKKIHFYSYSNTWHLDVKCIHNDVITLNDKDVKLLQEKYDCHEFDEWLADLEGTPDSERPKFFIFVIGDILEKEL